MTPLIETNWELFDEKEDVDFKQMNGWISEDKSLISRLENKYGTITVSYTHLTLPTSDLV